MNFLSHLSGMGATPPHHVRSNQPSFEDLVSPDNLKRLEGMKISFLSGGDNAVWSPQSTKASYDLMRGVFPQGEYERVVVGGYGHLDCWMGRDAQGDVFPRVRHHLEACEGAGERVEVHVPEEVEEVEGSYVDVTVEECNQ
jgi:hypothetical protein